MSYCVTGQVVQSVLKDYSASKHREETN